MTLGNPGRLAIHRRSDEIAFLQQRLRALAAALPFNRTGEEGPETTSYGARIQNNAYPIERNLQLAALVRERDLADELLHTRQIEPLGEALQRRLAMAERICRDLALRDRPRLQRPDDPDGPRLKGFVPQPALDATSAETHRVPTSARGTGGEGDQGRRSGAPDQVDIRDHLSEACWVAEIERRALTEMVKHWWAWLRKS